MPPAAALVIPPEPLAAEIPFALATSLPLILLLLPPLSLFFPLEAPFVPPLSEVVVDFVPALAVSVGEVTLMMAR